MLNRKRFKIKIKKDNHVVIKAHNATPIDLVMVAGNLIQTASDMTNMNVDDLVAKILPYFLGEENQNE